MDRITSWYNDTYYLFTFSDIYNGKFKGRSTKPLINIYIYIYTH